MSIKVLVCDHSRCWESNSLQEKRVSGGEIKGIKGGGVRGCELSLG